jgi:uncharacterized membrane protein YqjE
MFDPDQPAAARSEPGTVHGFKSALAVLSSMLHTRLDLFVTELEEERERLKQTLVLTLLLFFGLSFSFILLTIFIVALFWERGWIAAIGCLGVAYLAIAITSAAKLRNAILSRPRMFPATLQEISKDRDRLRKSSRE